MWRTKPSTAHTPIHKAAREPSWMSRLSLDRAQLLMGLSRTTAWDRQWSGILARLNLQVKLKQADLQCSKNQVRPDERIYSSSAGDTMPKAFFVVLFYYFSKWAAALRSWVETPGAGLSHWHHSLTPLSCRCAAGLFPLTPTWQL